jgi:hypothetical protein
MIYFISIILNERWVDINGFPNYQISDHGRVYSKESKKILKPQKRENGYLKVSLYNRGKTCKNKSLHKLVSEHFLESPINQGMNINHKDGIKYNNYYKNLEWVTPSENIIHAIKLGLLKSIGENNPSSIYTDDFIHEICKYIRHGYKQGEIYNKIKNHELIQNRVKTIDLIKKIKRKKSWCHISDLYGI